MFEFILRKIFLRKYSKNEQDTILLLQSKFETVALAFLLVSVFTSIPIILATIAILFGKISKLEQTLIIIISILYIIFVLFILKKRKGSVICIINNIIDKHYVKNYVMKGFALSNTDFEILKSVDPKLYDSIINQTCSGQCYDVVYRLIRALKEGEFYVVAVQSVNLKKEKNKTKYTLHVLYVKNNWCFDTFSMRQFPLNTTLEHFKAKLYKKFSYNDMKNISIDDFFINIAKDLYIWCKEIDCYCDLWDK